MLESKSVSQENPKYPTKSDLLELKRRVNMVATGANIHRAQNKLNVLNTIMDLAENEGWDDEMLKDYRISKRELDEALLGIK